MLKHSTKLAKLTIFLLSLMLVGCSNGIENISLPNIDLEKIAKNIAPADDSVTKIGTPLQLYNLVGRGIKTCWFSPSKPKLRKHIFFAQTSRQGENDAAEITIHELNEKGKRGLVAYRIYFSQSENSTTVRSNNVRLKPELGKELEADIARFASGKLDCSQTAAKASTKKS